MASDDEKTEVHVVDKMETPKMEESLRSLFEKEMIPGEVINYIEENMVLTERQFGFHADTREELKALIYDQVPEVKGKIWVLGRLVYVWHMVKKREHERLHPVPAALSLPVTQNNNEAEPEMCLADVQTLAIAFETSYGFRLSARATCSPKLLATIAKYITNKSHVFIAAATARSFDEAASVPRVKRIRVAEGLHFEQVEEQGDWRSLHSNYQFVDQLELLLVGGYAFVGNHRHRPDGPLFAPLQAVKTYIGYVKNKAVPYDAPHPPLNVIMKADSQTRRLWTESMRQGLTLGEAMEASRMQMEAFWLFACSAEAAQASSRVRQRSSWKESSPRPRTWSKGKGKGKGKGKSKGKKGGKQRRAPPPPVPSAPRVNGKRKLYVEKTHDGTQICRLWNVGKCVQGACPKNFAHVCNARSAGGAACGANHRRSSNH